MPRPTLFKRQLFVQKEFQWKFIVLYALSMALIIAASTWVLYRQIKQAVDKHLYSTHLKIEKVGDFLFDLMFTANFRTIAAIVILVLVLSLIVFRLINRTFLRMDQTLEAMAQGDFDKPYKPGLSFSEVGNLADLIEKNRIVQKERFAKVEDLLVKIKNDLNDQNETGLRHSKDVLNKFIAEISLN